MTKKAKPSRRVDSTTAAVDNLLNSSLNKTVDIKIEAASKVKRHDRTPVFNEAVQKELEKKQKAKEEIKNAQKTKKKGFTSFISEATRKVGFGHMSEENEDIALLCDQMHFDAKEAYKLLRTNVLFCLPDNDVCRTIGITSAIRGEGKSTASINLAYTFAVTGAKTLLIDMDMRLPSVATKLNITAGKGLSDYLIGTATINEVIRTTDKYKNWDIMLSGSIPPAPAELIGSTKMEKLIRSLERYYDFIIIDLPPINVVSDALIAKDVVDGFILAVRQDYSDKHSLADCIRQLDFLNANVLGFVMTDSDGGAHYYKKYGRKYSRYYRRYYRRRYGYYRKYGYYKKYGYGYGKKYGYGYGYGYGEQPKQEEKK